MLVLSRVNCDVVSMTQEEIPSIRSSNYKNFKATIYHGKPEESMLSEEIDFEFKGYKCLSSGSKLEITTNFSHEKGKKLTFSVGYDFSAFKEHSTFKEEKKFLGKSKVCFLYGYFRPSTDEKKEQKTVCYINFLSEELDLSVDDLIILNIFRINFDIRFTLDRLEVPGITRRNRNEEGEYKFKASGGLTSSSTKGNLNFEYGKQKITYLSDGDLVIPLIDENLRKLRKDNPSKIIPSVRPSLASDTKTVFLSFPTQTVENSQNVII